MVPLDETREGQERRSARSRNRLISCPAKIIFVKFQKSQTNVVNSLWDFVGVHTRPIACQGEAGGMAWLNLSQVTDESIWYKTSLLLQPFTSEKRMCSISSVDSADPWCFQSEELVKTGQSDEEVRQLAELHTSLARWMFTIGGYDQRSMVSTPKVMVMRTSSADCLYPPCWEVPFVDDQGVPVYVAGWTEGDHHAAALHAATFLLSRTWNLTKGISRGIADLRGY